MQNLTLGRARLGALALGLSAAMFTAFPLIRPFFPLDPTAPDKTLRAAGPIITSVWWTAAHSIAMLAFVLLVYGMLTLYAYPAEGQLEPRALRALAWSLAGIVLIMPMLGVETYILPIVGRLYLTGATDIAPAVPLIYLGPAIVVFLLGLLSLAIGAIYFGLTIWQGGGLPRWAGAFFATGLVLWFPPLPRTIRILDGGLIGLGGVWLAWAIWQRAGTRGRPRLAGAGGSAALDRPTGSPR